MLYVWIVMMNEAGIEVLAKKSNEIAEMLTNIYNFEKFEGKIEAVMELE